MSLRGLSFSSAAAIDLVDEMKLGKAVSSIFTFLPFDRFLLFFLYNRQNSWVSFVAVVFLVFIFSQHGRTQLLEQTERDRPCVQCLRREFS